MKKLYFVRLTGTKKAARKTGSWAHIKPKKQLIRYHPSRASAMEHARAARKAGWKAEVVRIKKRHKKRRRKSDDISLFGW